ncbi:hypothetical protein ACFYZ6_08965 [Streptomyces rubiginosohelvolus]|uniref:hypothetical protein n=2 Tax=Streptomyces TaxID=1883 RepID=UPI00211D96D7|nr:hypothetical protein [Streptomyces sp. ms184]
MRLISRGKCTGESKARAACRFRGDARQFADESGAFFRHQSQEGRAFGMTSPSGSASSNGEVKTLPFAVGFVVAFGTGYVCGEFFGFPWWQRLITVVVVVMALEGANQAVGRARARKKALGEPGSEADQRSSSS